MLLWRKERVLLVDPDPAVLGAYFEVLHDRFEVVTARDLDEAVRVLERERPAAVLADWNGSFPREGKGFRAFVAKRWADVRVLDFAKHLAPHVDTLRNLRLGAACLRSEPHPKALLDAMVASEDDPKLRSPYAN